MLIIAAGGNSTFAMRVPAPGQAVPRTPSPGVTVSSASRIAIETHDRSPRMSHPTPVRVHLYTALLDQMDDARALRCCEALLSPDERARQGQFVFERNRREFVYAHALVRLALSRHAPHIAPETWRFSVGRHGKPAVAGPTDAPALYFNLSHTRGLVACVVAAEPVLGVDVESMDRVGHTTEVAARFFASPEVESLSRLPVPAQRDWFFRFWTLKESYIKARGLGLALPLDQFWFLLQPEGPVGIGFGDGIIDTPSRWRFAERRPTPEHRLAVALALERNEGWTLEVVEGVIDQIGGP